MTYQITFRSADVVHGISAIPVLGIAEPGRSLPATTTSSRSLRRRLQRGRYNFACTRVCGVGHGGMFGAIEVEGVVVHLTYSTTWNIVSEVPGRQMRPSLPPGRICGAVVLSLVMATRLVAQSNNGGLVVGRASWGNVFINASWQFNVSGLYQGPWGLAAGANFFGRQGYPNPYWVAAGPGTLEGGGLLLIE